MDFFIIIIIIIITHTPQQHKHQFTMMGDHSSDYVLFPLCVDAIHFVYELL